MANSVAGADIAKIGNTLTVKQTADKVSLDWNRFDIGKQAAVSFEQPSATSIAINNIRQNDASQILGTLTANGQVYLLNQNGFLFGKDSQVNVNSLVASTLGISEAGLKDGITKAFANSDGAAALEGTGQTFYTDINGSRVKIEIRLEAGAKIKTESGGRVIVAAPSISNQGTIETPDGQTILAAAKDKVYLQEADSDSDIRGLLVEVGTGGDVNNIGKVLAEHGNASLIGFAVNQNGIASATTSVNLNGSVRLLAREGIQDPAQTGGKLVGARTKRSAAQIAELNDGLGGSAKVELGSGSLTSVDLDADKATTAIDAQAQTRSQIEISGHKVYLRDQSLIQAKSGDIGISALDDPGLPKQRGDARIYLESGAKIDASGVENVKLAADRNIVKVELRKNELRDSPLQRDGVLYGKTVKFDIRDVNFKYDEDGTLKTATLPIADVKGAIDRIARNIDERSTSGGAIKLNSSGDVVAKSGSTLDFSGGSVAYQAGKIGTTQLRSDGKIYDIADADPNRQYDAVLDKSGQHYVAGYIDGKAGGKLTINAYQALLEGNFDGNVVNGALQRLPSERASGSSVIIDLQNGNIFGKQDVVFDQFAGAQLMNADDPFPEKGSGSGTPTPLILNTGSLRNAGIRQFGLKTNGSVTLTKNSRLTLPNQGSLDIAAQNFQIDGAIAAPSGSVTLHSVTLNIAGREVPLPTAIGLGADASIDVGGVWINDGLDSARGKPLGTIAIDGGRISLTAEQADVRLLQGAQLRADGGAWRQQNGQTLEGSGGSIALSAASHDPTVAKGGIVLPNLTGTDFNSWPLRALGLKQNGKLTLESNEVVIGSAEDLPNRAGSGFQPLLLSPVFFGLGGFASYEIVSNYHGLTVADGAQIKLQQRNWQLAPASANLASGGTIANVSKLTDLPAEQRQSSELALTYRELTTQNRTESLRIGTGALLEADSKVGNGGIRLTSDTNLFVDGTLSAAGGNISLTVDSPTADRGFYPEQAIWLGSHAKLSATGVFRPAISRVGLQTGEVLDGGDVEITANRGYIVTETGSVIDVSGTAAELQFNQTNGRSFRAIASNGGKIGLTAGEGIVADGAWLAKSGGAGAEGGRLAISLNRDLRNKPDEQISDGLFPDDLGAGLTREIQIYAGNDRFLSSLRQFGDALDTEDYSGVALVSAARISSAGFDSLAFTTDAKPLDGHFTSGTRFFGNVELSAGRQIVLDTPEVAADGGLVRLNTAYAALGSVQVRNNTATTALAPEAIGGPGEFSVNAGAIELIGGLSFNGISNLTLVSAGDLRLRGVLGDQGARDYLGELHLFGNLNITASQVYPATLSQYKIVVSGSDSNVTFRGNGLSPAPAYSAGGKLTVEAANIDQLGVLKAPFGELTLNATNSLRLAASSVTSVSGAGTTVLFGRGSGGSDWLYPFDNSGTNNLVVSTPPEKRLVLSGNQIDLQSGATVDLSGGGDLYAYEFISGPGGSRDVLNVSATESFAVLPGYQNPLAPYDPLESAGSGLQSGDSVYLAAGSGLASGWYTILPAHYALLPGAFLITPQTGSQDQFQTTETLAGTTVVAGRYGVALTDFQDARWQGFAVESGTVARTRSQYTDYSANAFFATNKAAQLPRDAGSLVIEAASSLSLQGNLLANPGAGGFGGQVDISSDRLEVVASQGDLANVAAGTVALTVADLEKLNAPSLLLGGKRAKTAEGLRITAVSSSVSVSDDVRLDGREIMLTAKGEVTVESGAQIRSNGKLGSANIDLLLGNVDGTGDAALLRLSDAGQADVIRDEAVSGVGGVLRVGAGAVLHADAAMLLDSSKDTLFDGVIDMNGGSLALNSSKISLGKPSENSSGLVLTDARFDLDELRLTSAGDLDLYGGVQLNTSHLVLSAANINGFDNAGATASLNADVIELANRGASASRDGDGSGNLSLNAAQIRLAEGNYAIAGFNAVHLNATDGIFAASGASATGKLTVAADLTVNAGRFAGETGASNSLDAGSHRVELNALASDQGGNQSGLGVRWDISGGTIKTGARFDLPSGILAFTATGPDIEAPEGSNQTLTPALRITDGARIDLSGQLVAFSDVYRAAGAGTLLLTAEQGGVSLAAGSTINLAGAVLDNRQVSDAGLFSVSAGQGTFEWDGSVKAGIANRSSDATSGRFQLDAASFGNSGFSGLNAKLATAGFAEEQSLRQRNGDIVVAESDRIQARSIQLVADAGRVAIDGTLDASGETAGEVAVSGAKGIALGATGKLLATATGSGNAGGQVTLDTVDPNQTASGMLDLSAVGGLIDVSGGTSGEGGSVHLRTGRDSSHHVNVTEINTRIVGAAPQATLLEAARIYANLTSIKTANINTWRTDTQNFMATKPALVNQSGSAIEILPGIEARGSGNLALDNKWDFMDGAWSTSTSSWNSNWRYADASGAKTLPGFLTLRAQDDLNINASLTDALATTPLLGQDSKDRYQDVIQPGRSWSYNLIAGGNVNLAASYLGPNPQAASGNIKQQVVVRTGTGDIRVRAGKDIVIKKDASNNNSANNAAAIYTVGTTALYRRSQLLAGTIPGLPLQLTDETLSEYLARLDSKQLNQLLRYGLLDDTRVGASTNGYLYAEYPVNGGDIALQADGNIKGAQTGQQIGDWLVRSGVWDDTNKRPTAWGINLSGDRKTPTTVSGNKVYGKDSRNFNQNVGALGGGNVTVRAGGDISNLSVMLLTTGKPMGILRTANTWTTNGTVVNGGGDLRVSAGNDIVGGEFYTGKGDAELQAGGGIVASNVSADTQAGVLLNIGDGSFDLNARLDINLAGVVNPTLLKQNTPLPDKGSVNDTRFFTYSEDSALSLSSTAGDVILANDFNAIKTWKKLVSASGSGFEYSVYPATLKASALSGDIRIDNSLTLFPSRSGQLELLANRNIGTGSTSEKQIYINMSDTDPAALPGILNPAKFLEGNLLTGTYLTRELLDPNAPDPSRVHAIKPLHVNDANKPLIVAKTGNIAFPVEALATFYLPQAANILAGGNIVNMSLSGQNLSASDFTRIQAGGNIVFNINQDANGVIKSNDQAIKLGGPGQLQLIAGGNINLGSSQGVQTVGNILNAVLAPTGASIEILAGASGVDYAGFVQRFASWDSYRGAWKDATNIEEATLRKAWEAYQALLVADAPSSSDQGRLNSVLTILFLELKQAAEAAAKVPESQRSEIYALGSNAIGALFPRSDYVGDLALVFSQIKTLAGGDIQIAVPGGKIDVGLAGKVGGLSKSAEELGIVVQQSGALRLLAQGNVSVNQSRLFTMGGGDITAWSSKGDIDAGKGAKSAISAPKPIPVIDEKGNIKTVFPPVISGSGIQAIGGGNVYLAAPEGVVDAGEAGISGGQVVIAATAVIGASNIQASGGTIGVPTAVAAPAVPTGAEGAATGAARSAGDAPTAAGKPDEQNTADGGKSSVAMLSSDILGFGQCSVNDVRDGKPGCGG